MHGGPAPLAPPGPGRHGHGEEHDPARESQRLGSLDERAGHGDHGQRALGRAVPCRRGALEVGQVLEDRARRAHQVICVGSLGER